MSEVQSWSEDRIWEYTDRRVSRYSGEERNHIRYEVSECMRLLLTTINSQEFMIERLKSELTDVRAESRDREKIVAQDIYKTLREIANFIDDLAIDEAADIQEGGGLDERELLRQYGHWISVLLNMESTIAALQKKRVLLSPERMQALEVLFNPEGHSPDRQLEANTLILEMMKEANHE
jgi:hypothetical protein